MVECWGWSHPSHMNDMLASTRSSLASSATLLAAQASSLASIGSLLAT